MTSPTNEQQRVDVLQRMDAFIGSLQAIHVNTVSLEEARAAVAELIEAVIKNREATQEFANDGQPDNYRRWDASERRLLAALANAGCAK